MAGSIHVSRCLMRPRDGSEGAMRKAVKPYLSNPVVVIGGFLTIGWLLVAIFAPLLAPYDPIRTLLPLAKPGMADKSGNIFWLGTDKLGRDILSRLIYGARTV